MKNRQEPPKINKLTRRQFAAALQKGLGRAYLHVLHDGIDEVADLVLKVCLKDLAYDPQSESTKAPWLYKMFGGTPHFHGFRKSILAALRSKKDTWDLVQLFELALIMAEAGDEESKVAIKMKAFRKAGKLSEDDWLGSGEWIELNGLDGALELAETYGKRLLKNPDDFVPDDLLWAYEELKPELNSRLQQLSQSDPRYEAYFQYLKKRGVLEPKSHQSRSGEQIQLEVEHRLRHMYPLPKILKDAQEHADQFGIEYSQFGKVATPEELDVVYQYLLDSSDLETIWRLLRVFRTAKLPQLNENLFIWANNEHEKLSWAAIGALSNITDDRVHKLGRKKVQSGSLLGENTEVLGLFVNNYSSKDAADIYRALRILRPGKEDAHSLGWGVIDIANKQRDPALGDALRWAYEKTPCSNCRHRIIEQLDSIGQFTGDILYECQFDSEVDIAALAKKRIAEQNIHSA